MNGQTILKDPTAMPLIKADPNSPVFKVTGRDGLIIKAGTRIGDLDFPQDKIVTMPGDGLEAGADYAVTIDDGVAAAFRLDAAPVSSSYLGGFHFAPGGNAAARSGGDDIPAINPCSLWDANFRPACKDARGMTLVASLKFWADIYLLGVNHLTDGTSKFGVTIADGRDCPLAPNGEPYSRLDYETAVAVMAHHGKGLMSQGEFEAFAFGVTERTACGTDPKVTGLDMKRTSQVGGMQPAGSMWIWGHDGSLRPRASVLGGSWFSDGGAGSRCAIVGYWPESSHGSLGARGRSDHLQLV